MKKIVLSLTVGTMVLGGTISGVSASSEGISSSSIEHYNHECSEFHGINDANGYYIISNGEIRHSEYNVITERELLADPEARVIPAAILKQFMKFSFKSSAKSACMLMNWMKADPSGYNKYVYEVNRGGTHCYNMCSMHSNINPTKYGYKSAYDCRHSGNIHNKNIK